MLVPLLSDVSELNLHSAIVGDKRHGLDTHHLTAVAPYVNYINIDIYYSDYLMAHL